MFNSREMKECYQTAHRLAVEIHRMTSALPLFAEDEEGRRVRKSSQSVTVHMIQALWHRGHDPMHLRFLVYAHTACEETMERLRLILDTRLLKQGDWVEYFLEEYAKLRSCLEGLLLNEERETCLKN